MEVQLFVEDTRVIASTDPKVVDQTCFVMLRQWEPSRNASTSLQLGQLVRTICSASLAFKQRLLYEISSTSAEPELKVMPRRSLFLLGASRSNCCMAVRQGLKCDLKIRAFGTTPASVEPSQKI